MEKGDEGRVEKTGRESGPVHHAGLMDGDREWGMERSGENPQVPLKVGSAFGVPARWDANLVGRNVPAAPG